MNDGTPLDEEDYSFAPEPWWLRTPDDLVDRRELLEQLAQQLPLDEAAETLGPQYAFFLWHMSMKYANPGSPTFLNQEKNVSLALPYADALVAAFPNEDNGYETRAYCRAHLIPIDYKALLIDYKWLAERPLRGKDYWTAKLHTIQDDPEHYAYLVDQSTNEDLYRRTHYYLACAWAYYHSGRRQHAMRAFNQAFEQPARSDFGFSPDWPVDLLPPVPDPEYLLWQLERQLARRPWERHSEAVQDWIGEASREYQRLTPGSE